MGQPKKALENVKLASLFVFRRNICENYSLPRATAFDKLIEQTVHILHTHPSAERETKATRQLADDNGYATLLPANP